MATPPTHPGDRFIDDNTSIFEDDIERLASAGITRGCNPPLNTSYCPDRYVTRGQMAAFLVRAMGYTDNPAGDRFVDDNGSIFEDDIERLAAAEVTRGCNPPTSNRYCHNSHVTRGPNGRVPPSRPRIATGQPGSRTVPSPGIAST